MEGGGMSSKKRKRLSPPDDYTKFFDELRELDWHVGVERHHDTETDTTKLKIVAWKGDERHESPLVDDPSMLALASHAVRESMRAIG
jgi:hypothetical protein